MITFKDIDKATLDDTSTEDFEKLLKQYYAQNLVSDASKKRFQELVAKTQQTEI